MMTCKPGEANVKAIKEEDENNSSRESKDEILSSATPTPEPKIYRAEGRQSSVDELRESGDEDPGKREPTLASKSVSS